MYEASSSPQYVGTQLRSMWSSEWEFSLALCSVGILILNFPDSRTVKSKCLLFKFPAYGICMTAYWMDEDTNQTEVHTPPASMGSSTHNINFLSQSPRLRYQTAEDVAEPSRVTQTSLPKVWLLFLTHYFLLRHQSLVCFLLTPSASWHTGTPLCISVQHLNFPLDLNVTIYLLMVATSGLLDS